MNKYTLFGPLGSPNKHKTTCILALEDLEYLKKVFPECGMQTNIPGFLVARYCDALRAEGILTDEQRRASPLHFNVLSSIDTCFSKAHPASFPTVATPPPL